MTRSVGRRPSARMTEWHQGATTVRPPTRKDGTRIVFLLLTIAALGLTLITMHAMHVGQPGSAAAAPMSMTGHAVAPDLAPALQAGHLSHHGATQQALSSTPSATGHATTVAPCPGPACLIASPGPGDAMSMLCLGLLPAAALLLLLLLGGPTAHGLQHQARAPGNRSQTTMWCAPPRPPSLTALCILRT